MRKWSVFQNTVTYVSVVLCSCKHIVHNCMYIHAVSKTVYNFVCTCVHACVWCIHTYVCMHVHACCVRMCVVYIYKGIYACLQVSMHVETCMVIYHIHLSWHVPYSAKFWRRKALATLQIECHLPIFSQPNLCS